MDAAVTIRAVRTRAGLSLRALALRAETSHSAVAAYESHRKVPTVDTLDRIVRAAGFELALDLVPNVSGIDREARGRELVEALELAAEFPARHAAELPFPRFGTP